MHVALLVLLIILLILVIALVVLMLVNAIKRVCFPKNAPQRSNTNANDMKIVDFFIANKLSLDALLLNAAPGTVCPGMTALIDLGIANMDTGVYMLQNNNIWVKITVPEVNQIFYIKRGEFACKQHTIRPSFLVEIKPPSETQIFNSENASQRLGEATSTVFIEHNINVTPQVLINPQDYHHASNGLHTGRLLTIINTSPQFSCMLVLSPFFSNIAVEKQKILQLQLNIKCNENRVFYYEPLAFSAGVCADQSK